MSAVPAVSIGLPVRNGERFLARQLESLLAQDFADFELVISDNASTDRTREICEEYARRDSRLHYHRTDVDRGLAWNWNRVFELARAPYFKWAAHDDEHGPTYLSQCVAVLEADPTVVCCHSATVDIDEDGRVMRVFPARVAPASPIPHVRFADMLRPHQAFQIFGLMRRDALQRTGLHRPIPEIDHVLLAELALQGRIVELPEPLFRRRDHSGRSVRVFRTARARRRLYAGQGGAVPAWPGLALTVEMVKAVRRSPVRGRERLLCWLALRQWVRRNAMRLRRDSLSTVLTWAGYGDRASAAENWPELVQVARQAVRERSRGRAHPPPRRTPVRPGVLP